MVSDLTFRSLIHFEFIFVYVVRECSNFILLHVVVQFPQYQLLKRFNISSISYSCPLCCRLTLNSWVYLWTLYSVPLIYISVFVPVPILF